MSSAHSDRALLAVDRLDVRAGGKMIVHDATFAAACGELVAIVGPNGAGKSTLLRAVAGVSRLHGGSVEWLGEPVSSLGARRLARLRAFLPQRPSAPPGLTVADAVLVGRSAHVGMLRSASDTDRIIVSDALATCGLDSISGRMVDSLSGGEQQRVFLALAIAQQAAALIVDEPTTHLDVGAARSVGKLLRDQADSGRAVLAVLHDLELACALADRVLVVNDGQLVADAVPSEAIDRDRLRTVWGVEGTTESLAGGRARVVLAPIIGGAAS